MSSGNWIIMVYETVRQPSGVVKEFPGPSYGLFGSRSEAEQWGKDNIKRGVAWTAREMYSAARAVPPRELVVN